jgi:DMSO reductase anchor subunit
MSLVIYTVLFGGTIGVFAGGACMWMAIGLAHSEVTQRKKFTQVLPAAILGGILIGMISYLFVSSL